MDEKTEATQNEVDYWNSRKDEVIKSFDVSDEEIEQLIKEGRI